MIVSATVKYGRIIVLWALDIKHMPRTSVKGQILVNLVAKFTEPLLEEVAATKSMDEESVNTSPCKNLYSERYILISSNLSISVQTKP